MTAEQTPLASPQSPAISRSQLIRTALLSIFINAVCPLVAYNLLTPALPEVEALTIAACIPLVDNLYSLAKNRRLDVFGVFMLLGFLVSIGLVLLGSDKRFILIKRSFLTGVLGLLMLGSLALPRPILFYFAANFTAGNSPQARAEFENKWVIPYFRFVMYLMTIVWGLTLVIEAAVRSILAFTIDSTETFLAISPIVQYGFLGAAIAWTVWYRKYSMRRFRRNQTLEQTA